MNIARLKDGVTLDQALKADDPSSVATDLQTIAGIAPGATGTLDVKLTPGNWVLACFLPAPDGAPHVAHGMVSEITVSS